MILAIYSIVYGDGGGSSRETVVLVEYNILETRESRRRRVGVGRRSGARVGVVSHILLCHPDTKPHRAEQHSKDS
jgi:hypothetical protein